MRRRILWSARSSGWRLRLQAATNNRMSASWATAQPIADAEEVLNWHSHDLSADDAASAVMTKASRQHLRDHTVPRPPKCPRVHAGVGSGAVAHW